MTKIGAGAVSVDEKHTNGFWINHGDLGYWNEEYSAVTKFDHCGDLTNWALLTNRIIDYEWLDRLKSRNLFEE